MNFRILCGGAEAYVNNALIKMYPVFTHLTVNDWMILAENRVIVYNWNSLAKWCDLKLSNKAFKIIINNEEHYAIKLPLFFVNILLRVHQSYNTADKDVIILIDNDILVENITNKNIKKIYVPINNNISQDISNLNVEPSLHIRTMFDSRSNTFLELAPNIKNEDNELLIVSVKKIDLLI